MNRGLYAGLPRTTAKMRGLQVDGQTGATAVGDQTGPLVSTNTYIGYQAGQNTANQPDGIAAASASGRSNTFIGYQAGLNNTTGGSNVYIGYGIVGPQPSANSNVMIGANHTFGGSGGTNTGNVWIGCSLTGAVTSGSTVIIGGNASATASGVVAIGYNVLCGGSNSVAVGQNANGNNAGGVAVGVGAVAGVSGVTIGSSAGAGNGSTGQVSVGANAGRSNTSGNNTFLGYQSGYSPASLGTTYATTTGTGQTCIGYQTGQAVVSATAPNYITCLGWETTVGASGGVAIGTDHTGAGATTSTQDAIQLGTSNHTIISSGKIKMAAHGITSGALSTVTLSSGMGAQVDTTCDRFLAILGTAVLATDTIAIALSADNTTYTTLGTLTPGVASTDIYTIAVPAGWYCRVTASGSASIVANSVYY